MKLWQRNDSLAATINPVNLERSKAAVDEAGNQFTKITNGELSASLTHTNEVGEASLDVNPRSYIAAATNRTVQSGSTNSAIIFSGSSTNIRAGQAAIIHSVGGTTIKAVGFVDSVVGSTATLQRSLTYTPVPGDSVSFYDPAVEGQYFYGGQFLKLQGVYDIFGSGSVLPWFMGADLLTYPGVEAHQGGAWSVSVGKTALTAASPTFATVGISSAQAVAVNSSRKGLILTNTSANTISLGIGASAVLNSGPTLYPGGVWVMDEYTFSTAVINAIASAAASNLAIQSFS